jgi:hypothetical protein
LFETLVDRSAWREAWRGLQGFANELGGSSGGGGSEAGGGGPSREAR